MLSRYDLWKSTPPERGGTCDGCDERLDEEPIVDRLTGEAFCSYVCEARAQIDRAKDAPAKFMAAMAWVGEDPAEEPLFLIAFGGVERPLMTTGFTVMPTPTTPVNFEDAEGVGYDIASTDVTRFEVVDA